MNKLKNAFAVALVGGALALGIMIPDHGLAKGTECNRWAADLGVTENDSILMASVGCDEARGVYYPAPGECNKAARAAYRRGYEPNSVEFRVWVAENNRAKGDCTIYDDGSWSEPRG